MALKKFLAGLRGRAQGQDGPAPRAHAGPRAGPRDQAGDESGVAADGQAAREEIAILLRIEGHLAELVARTRHLDRLDRRLRDIETALRQL